jgi:hypothetical protein
MYHAAKEFRLGRVVLLTPVKQIVELCAVE